MPLLTINDTFAMQRQWEYRQALRWAQAQWAQLERPSDAEAERGLWQESEEDACD